MKGLPSRGACGCASRVETASLPLLTATQIPTGGVQGVEGVVDLAGGLVVVEGLADLAAGQPVRVLAQGGVDPFGERIAGRAGQRPGGGSGRVAVEGERGGEVRRLYL